MRLESLLFLRGEIKAMQQTMQQLFRMALGLADPWKVSKIEFSEEKRQLDIWLDFGAGSQFSCPTCATACGVYDSSE